MWAESISVSVRFRVCLFLVKLLLMSLLDYYHYSSHLIGSSKASHSRRDVPNVRVGHFRYASVLSGREKKQNTQVVYSQENVFFISNQTVLFFQ